MDDRLLRLINRDWTHPVADYVMAVFSSYDFWLPFLCLAAVVIAWRGSFQARTFLVLLAVTMAVVNWLVGLAKPVFDRPRPNQHLSQVRWIDLDSTTAFRALSLFKALEVRINSEPLGVPAGKGRSFPSGHSANLFCAATVAALCFRRGWTAFFVAALTGYSRVYVGAHHPSDVLVTALFAATVAIFTVGLLSWLWERWGQRVWPSLHLRHPRLLGAESGQENAVSEPARA
ncbi:MAG: phosphatase PAP2 family protein [Verrucomicrobia bacterium]|nr:phosphatase PAP2 family protein [Verrucomicrobiota bacterium]